MDSPLVDLLFQALWLALFLALPFVLGIALVGLFMGLMQRATGIQHSAISFAPRFVVGVVFFVALLPWILDELGYFMASVFEILRMI